MIIADTHNVDPASDIDLDERCYLAETPFPGDVINSFKGRQLLVVRREFLDHGEYRQDADRGLARQFIDVKLAVRLAN